MALCIPARPRALLSPAPQKEGRSTQGNSHERNRPQFFATDVAIISLNLSELAVQKQLYDVVFPPSPHPATMSRTIELMGGSAHDGSESYPSAWLR
ncbi:hypothetical protein CTAM01_07336 [Colletotrichum tamarilloi]|uniref:Uncharacterized protein n=1 Tax=Colletotrichum tamarilloi TaxID=1209934 RepID=A0ABQ9RA28_9PEZI|nr:uncharacterized protein CTAM01_07336 [Colletotrichum tamarilloi]KAK1498607.1 hypothetical protein CTAM01_07336 [Colletotrichum tamarilloi]